MSRRIYHVLLTTAFIVGQSANGADWALVVVVDDCPRFRLPGGARPRPLKGAERNARAFADFLQKTSQYEESHFHLILGKQATLNALGTAFEDLQRKSAAGDAFVFYFSAHGTQLDDQKPFDEADELDEALCLADAQPDGEGLLLDDQLGLWLDDLECRHITVVLDCCHSGTGIKELDDDIVPRYLPGRMDPVRRDAPPTIRNELQNTTKGIDRSLTAVYACQPEQQAYERRFTVGPQSVRSGQFTHFLLQGLESRDADRDNDDSITAEEAVGYVLKELDQTFNRERKNPSDRQTPALDSSRPNRAFLTR